MNKESKVEEEIDKEITYLYDLISYFINVQALKLENVDLNEFEELYNTYTKRSKIRIEGNDITAYGMGYSVSGRDLDKLAKSILEDISDRIQGLYNVRTSYKLLG